MFPWSVSVPLIRREKRTFFFSFFPEQKACIHFRWFDSAQFECTNEDTLPRQSYCYNLFCPTWRFFSPLPAQWGRQKQFFFYNNSFTGEENSEGEDWHNYNCFKLLNILTKSIFCDCLACTVFLCHLLLCLSPLDLLASTNSQESSHGLSKPYLWFL